MRKNKKSKIIKLGPKQANFEEPFIVHLETKNNIIKNVEIEIGFLHRGIEKLASQKNFYQNLGLVERICGYCSFTHSLAYVEAVENLCDIKAPLRARYIRTIIAEIERLHSHLLWADLVTEKLGFEPISGHIVHFRESVLDLLEKLTGGRIMYEINTIGGVLKDINEDSDILRQIDWLKDIAIDIKEIFEKNKEIKKNTKGLGVLSKEKALKLGVVGPTARASGVKIDVRKDAPYAAYKEISNKKYIVLKDGDCFSRIYIHFLELIESLEIITQALLSLPQDSLKVPGGQIFVPSGYGIGRVEAPRGELFHFILTDSGDTLKRLKVRPPTYMNLPALKEMLIGEKRELAGTIIASLDPCFSCTER